MQRRVAFWITGSVGMAARVAAGHGWDLAAVVIRGAARVTGRAGVWHERHRVEEIRSSWDVLERVIQGGAEPCGGSCDAGDGACGCSSRPPCSWRPTSDACGCRNGECSVVAQGERSTHRSSCRRALQWDSSFLEEPIAKDSLGQLFSGLAAAQSSTVEQSFERSRDRYADRKSVWVRGVRLHRSPQALMRASLASRTRRH